MSLYRPVSRSLAATGVSLGHREVSEADHWILSLDPAPALACTHLVQAPFPHVAVSVVSSSSFETTDELRAGAEAAASGKFGRAVIFAGSAELTGRRTVAEIVSSTAIDRVEVLGSGVADDDAVVDTRDFVRPQYRSGDLVLVTMPAAGGVLVPFETREPTPCCADHA
ncbi:hypothetical protein JIG36_40235 [Actinoplanes sp. LDG1-06]|uniref:Uncharacterized protein n=1 Tax=Paractinoplanes ovalisporus TaxID=2810368 RepID=A0ABS2APM6_9ACTN|nr:hypothetical protein [Actinoplanes ovalisporus]MBM2621751.1 hypothetical protein [Actinoplanes ovalisporus]